MPGRVLAQADEGTPPASVPPAALPSAPPTPGADTPAPPADREVREGEVVDIRVEGNRRVEAEAVRRALRTKVGQVFDEARTAEDLRAVWALGYFSDVQLLTQQLPNGGIAYVVRVQERPSIRAVKLAGNEELSQEDLKEAIEV